MHGSPKQFFLNVSESKLLRVHLISFWILFFKLKFAHIFWTFYFFFGRTIFDCDEHTFKAYRLYSIHDTIQYKAYRLYSRPIHDTIQYKATKICL